MTDKTFRVLLIEDDLGDARRVLKALREAQGSAFEVRHADRLAVGLKALASAGFDALLLDLDLPDSSGLEAVLRARDTVPEVPIVVLTGIDDEELALRAVREGAQDYLIKGVHGDLLVRGLRYAIERKKIQEQLRQSQDQLRTIIDNTPIILFATDPEGRLTVSEGRGLEGLGVKPGEVNQQSIFDLFANQQDIMAVMQRGLSGEEAAATVRLNRRAFDLHVAPLREDTTSVQGIIGVSTDITERVQAEEALRETLLELEARNLELESFTYSVSHDLKEPLRTLEAFSQFVLEDYADRLDDQGQDYLTRMAQASARMKQMIEELLMLSRLGRQPQITQRVPVSTVIGDIISTMQAAIEWCNGRIDIVGGLPDINGEVLRVQQIFGNLFSNALKFNKSNAPTVEVGLLEQRGDQVVFFVRDNGIGIEADYHAQIFAVFQRLHRREDYDGTGAGLAIVKRAAEAMGGTVWLESTPDQGSTFFVALPRWEERLVRTHAAA